MAFAVHVLTKEKENTTTAAAVCSYESRTNALKKRRQPKRKPSYRLQSTKNEGATPRWVTWFCRGSLSRPYQSILWVPPWLAAPGISALLV